MLRSYGVCSSDSRHHRIPSTNTLFCREKFQKVLALLVAVKVTVCRSRSILTVVEGADRTTWNSFARNDSLTCTGSNPLFRALVAENIGEKTGNDYFETCSINGPGQHVHGWNHSRNFSLQLKFLRYSRGSSGRNLFSGFPEHHTASRKTIVCRTLPGWSLSKNGPE